MTACAKPRGRQSTGCVAARQEARREHDKASLRRARSTVSWRTVGATLLLNILPQPSEHVHSVPSQNAGFAA
jgi:hypothetical protein